MTKRISSQERREAIVERQVAEAAAKAAEAALPEIVNTEEIEEFFVYRPPFEQVGAQKIESENICFSIVYLRDNATKNVVAVFVSANGDIAHMMFAFRSYGTAVLTSRVVAFGISRLFLGGNCCLKSKAILRGEA